MFYRNAGIRIYLQHCYTLLGIEIVQFCGHCQREILKTYNTLLFKFILKLVSIWRLEHATFIISRRDVNPT
jgi:hypothetical protein